MIILSSPSGAGKTTLVKKIVKNKNFTVSVSHTTRKPRVKEKNGVAMPIAVKKILYDEFKESFNKSYSKINWLIDLVSNIRSTKVDLNV